MLLALPFTNGSHIHFPSGNASSNALTQCEYGSYTETEIKQNMETKTGPTDRNNVNVILFITKYEVRISFENIGKEHILHLELVPYPFIPYPFSK